MVLEGRVGSLLDELGLLILELDFVLMEFGHLLWCSNHKINIYKSINNENKIQVLIWHNYILRIYLTNCIILMKAYLVFLLFALFLSVRAQKTNCTIDVDLNDYAVNDHQTWNKIKHFLSSNICLNLYMDGIIISELGLKEFLKLNVNFVITLQMKNIVMNKKLMDILLRDSLFKRLQLLVMDNCNIHDEDLQYLHSESLMLSLSLANNYLSTKGFQRLARCKFLSMQTLIIDGNSLIEDQAVNSLLKLNLGNLIQLSLASTSISEKNLLRVLNAIDTNQIQALIIADDNYSPEFYRQLSGMKFNSLTGLDLRGLLIDEEDIEYLKHWRLPNLQRMDISENSLKSETGMKWINKKNMPKLNVLAINFNFFNSTFIEHLKNEGFVFEILYSRIFNMDPDALIHLSQMNLSQLTLFGYDFTVGSPQLMEQFFNNTNLKKLQTLSLMNVINGGEILRYLLQANLKSLKIADISSAYNSQDYDIPELEDKVYFPSLQTLVIGSPKMRYGKMRQFVENITIFCPKIKTLQITQYVPELYQKIIEGKFYNVKHKFSLTMPGMKFEFHPKRLPYAIIGNIPYLVTRKLLLEDEQLPENIQYFNQVYTLFDWSKVESLVDSTGIGFIKKHKPNSQCTYHTLKSLSYGLTDLEDMQEIKKCHYPKLTSLTFNVTFPQTVFQFYFLDTKTFHDVSSLAIISPNPNTEIIEENMHKYHYYRLLSLNLNHLHLKDKNMHNIIKKNNFHRLKKLDLRGNFLFQSNDTFSLKKLMLKSLDLSNIFIWNKFHLLSDLNTEFLTQLYLAQCGIQEQSFIQFLAVKEQNSVIPFPKLFTLELGENYISIRGIQYLFETKLPLIRQLGLYRIDDPDLFNTVFRSPSSKRLIGFILANNYLQKIDPNIDPRNTRRLITFILQSYSLKDEDYQTLGKFEFLSLVEVRLILSNVTQCETLKAIRKIVFRADMIGIGLQESSLDAECLEVDQKMEKMMLPSELEIQVVGNPVFYIQKFTNSFLNPHQKFQILQIPFNYVSQSKIKEMSEKSDINQTRILMLTGNNLSDISISPLLKNDLRSLQLLFLDKNILLTGDGLAGMVDKVYSNLTTLDLSETSIGDKGIEYLSRAKFPKLVNLFLKSINITSKGMEYLSKMDFPELQVLDLSCNDLKVDDLLKLDERKMEKLTTIYLYPFIKSQEKERIQENFPLNVNLTVAATVLPTEE